MYEWPWFGFAVGLLDRRYRRDRDWLANATLEEVEDRWVQERLHNMHRKIGRIIADLAKLTGPWRHVHGYKHRSYADQSSSLKRMLKRAKPKNNIKRSWR